MGGGGGYKVSTRKCLDSIAQLLTRSWEDIF